VHTRRLPHRAGSARFVQSGMVGMVKTAKPNHSYAGKVSVKRDSQGFYS